MGSRVSRGLKLGGGRIDKAASVAGVPLRPDDPNNPDQTLMDGIPITERLVDRWLESSDNTSAWHDEIAKAEGRDVVDSAFGAIPERDLSTIYSRMASEWYDRYEKMGQKEIGDKFWAAYNESKTISGWLSFPNVSDKMTAEQNVFVSKLRNAVVKKFRSEITERFSARFNPKYYNREAVNKSIVHLREEAKLVVKTPQVVFRGVHFDSLTKAVEIRRDIETKGFHDLPVFPVSSFTTKDTIAKRFAKSGESGSKSASGSGIVFKAVATMDNVVMHYKQPTMQASLKSMKARGEKFFIGGSTQNEVVLSNGGTHIRLTKDNFIGIER